MADTVNTLLTGIENSKGDIATSIEGKGVSVPSGTKLAGMSALIDQISVMHGPSSSIDGNLAAFNGTSGDTLKDSGINASNLVTTQSKTYTGLIGTGNEYKNATFYFVNIMPDSWNKEWSIRYRIDANLDDGITPTNYEYFSSTHECFIAGSRGYYTSYAFFNAINHTSYRPIFYNALHETTETGFNNNYPHLIGVELTSSTNPTDTNYKRTIKITILATTNCTATLLDAPKIPSQSTRSDYTKISSTYYPNGADSNAPGYDWRGNLYANGMYETADDNSVDRLYYHNQWLTIGSLGLPGYSLFGFNSTGQVQAISNKNSSQSTGDAGIDTQRIYNSTGFDWTRPLLRWVSNGYYASGTTNLIHADKVNTFDFRYTDNLVNAASTNLTMVAGKDVYLRGTIGIDGLFFLAPITVTYNNANYQRVWTQDIPTTDDGYVYWLVGHCYSGNTATENRQDVRLYAENPLFWFKNGKFRGYDVDVVHTIGNEEIKGTKTLLDASLKFAKDMSVNTIDFGSLSLSNNNDFIVQSLMGNNLILRTTGSGSTKIGSYDQIVVSDDVGQYIGKTTFKQQTYDESMNSHTAYYNFPLNVDGNKIIATTDDIPELVDVPAIIDCGVLGNNAESAWWTVEKFDLLYNDTSTEVASSIVDIKSSIMTRETYNGYPALNFNVSGPSAIVYKNNNKIYGYSAASSSNFYIYRYGTNASIYNALLGANLSQTAPTASSIPIRYIKYATSGSNFASTTFYDQDDRVLVTSYNNYPTRIYTSGLQISNYVGNTNCVLYVPYATTSKEGVVTTLTQSFAGAKTFTDNTTIGTSSSAATLTIYNNITYPSQFNNTGLSVNSGYGQAQASKYIAGGEGSLASHATYDQTKIIYSTDYSYPGGFTDYELSFPSKSGTLALTNDVEDILMNLGDYLGYVNLGAGVSANGTTPTTESSIWTVEMFDAANALTSTTISYNFIGAGMSGTGAITRETYLGYPAINFNMSGPYYIVYKANNKIYVYSLVNTDSQGLRINKTGTASDLYTALGGHDSYDTTTHAFTAQSVLDIIPTRQYSTGLMIGYSKYDTQDNVYNLFVPYANNSQGGVVSGSSQSFTGQKTFTSKVIIGNPSNYSPTVVLDVGKTNSYGGGFSFYGSSAGSAGDITGYFDTSSSSYPEIKDIKQIVFHQGYGGSHAPDTYSTTLVSSSQPSANVTLTLPNTSGTLGFAIDVVDLR